MGPIYDERIVGPMREELTRLGFEETRTPQQVDSALADQKGTVLVVVNPSAAARPEWPGRQWRWPWSMT